MQTKTKTPLLNKYLKENKHLFTPDKAVLDKKLADIQNRYKSQLRLMYPSLHHSLVDVIEKDKSGYKLISSKLGNSKYIVVYEKPESIQSQEIQDLKNKAKEGYLAELELVKTGLITELTATIEAEKEAELEAKKEADKLALHTEISALLG